MSGITVGRDSTPIDLGAPHGLCSIHKDRVNSDLLAFIGA